MQVRIIPGERGRCAVLPLTGGPGIMALAQEVRACLDNPNRRLRAGRELVGYATEALARRLRAIATPPQRPGIDPHNARIHAREAKRKIYRLCEIEGGSVVTGKHGRGIPRRSYD